LSSTQITEQILSLAKQQLVASQQFRFLLLAPVVKDRKGEYDELFASLRQKGFSRIRLDKVIHSLTDDFVLIKTNRHTIEVVIDRVVIDKKSLKNSKEILPRLFSSVETALKLGAGEIIVSQILDKSLAFPENPQEYDDHLYSEKFACADCGISLSQIEPRSFSFNSPHGACPTCTGIGSLLTVDPDLVFAPSLSIDEGGILPFTKMFENNTWYARIVRTACWENNLDTKTSINKLSAANKELLLHGTGERIYRVAGQNRRGEDTAIQEVFAGIIPELEKRYKETDSDFVRMEIVKFMRQEICPTCQGTRLKKEVLSVSIAQKNIAEISSLSISLVYDWLNKLTDVFSDREKQISQPILKELLSRLRFLLDVGLDYLTINRSSQSLAGGEAQRIRLASQIGSGLSGVMYVLDEPSIGLHPRDNDRLIATLKKLRDLGNSVIVVEHDKDMKENADINYDFGPCAGEHGGKIVALGTTEELKRNKHSLTGAYLSGKKSISVSHSGGVINHDEQKYLTLVGITHHNLKNITVQFPLGKFICLTGVSGSGKSTLLIDTLYHALALTYNPLHKDKPGHFKNIKGLENLDKVILIDQSPIGRTPRSNPATYTGAFSHIRELFSLTKEAKIRGYKTGRFSFNVKGGRCEVCQGEGQIKIEMQFLPDVYVTCEVCQGKRYNEQALEIFYHNKNIAEILNMTVEEAINFFSNNATLVQKLSTLNQVGLGYLRLGQPAPTLSGGEAQRVKLATELSKRATGRTVYLLDEPTTGLHFADLEKLLNVLHRLVSLGNTVIVIEHNLDVIKNADYIIDLGPEGGDKGGEIIAQGTPKDVAKNSSSYTGKFLRSILK
ncbi:excinuclease ABC subunit UvrA, partial [Candidatus Gottesmanbacteria bacterium]|nr:excinuclease ABC subunit UvrA [Candidatus Gottesmanbacteria bacterium]